MIAVGLALTISYNTKASSSLSVLKPHIYVERWYIKPLYFVNAQWYILKPLGRMVIAPLETAYFGWEAIVCVLVSPVDGLMGESMLH